MKRLAILAAALLLWSAPARAAVIFSENFNAENGGVGVLNYNSFAQFSVSGGSVDLIGNGFWDLVPGNGLYVDMDGSTGNAGLMSAAGIPLGAGSYLFSFDVAGSHRGTADTMLFNVFGASTYLTGSVVAASGVPFTNLSFSFVLPAPDSVMFSFEGVGGDNVGLLLDDVQLSSVPEPGTVLLLATGLVAAWRRSAARA